MQMKIFPKQDSDREFEFNLLSSFSWYHRSLSNESE